VRGRVSEFEEEQEEQLDRLDEESSSPSISRNRFEKADPKSRAAGKYRKLGIPTVYDRVCQQALLNRLGPIFERYSICNLVSSWEVEQDGLRKVWRELERVVSDRDADLKDFFGSVDQEKLMTLITNA